jgi:ABC-2 type transport system permease protein
MALTLLRPQFLILRNKLRKATRLGFRREMMLLLVSAIIVVCIYLAFHMLFRVMQTDEAFLSIIPRKLIDMLFSYFLILLALSATVSAMGKIYSSETIQLALQAPVSSFKLYTAKFLETAIEVGFMFFILTGPAALAYVTQLGVHWSFIPVGTILSAIFILIPIGFGIALATIFAQAIAFMWRRGGILLFLITATFFAAAFELAGELQQVQEKREGAKAFAGMVGITTTSTPFWLPSRWISDILGAWLTGFGEGLAAKFLLLITAAAISYCIGFFVFDLLSMRVRSSAHVHLREETLEGFRGRKDFFRRLLERLVSVVPLGSQERAIVLKDLSSTVRDRAQSLQLLLYLGLGALYVTVYSFLSSAMTLSMTGQQVWIGFLASSNVMLVGFMTTTILTRLVYPSVSLEGRSFWILQVTPIRIREMVAAKLLCWLPLTIFLSGSLMGVGALAVGLSVLESSLVVLIGVAITLATTGVAIGLGARYASFDWESPSQLAVGLGTLTLLLLSVSLVILFSIPSAYIIFLTVVPELRGIVGPVLSFVTMSLALFAVLIGSMWLMHSSISSGSRALLERLREV